MEKNSLSHTSWECIYHVVWIPKYRRKVLYGETRREIGEMLWMLVDHMDGVEIVDGTPHRDGRRAVHDQLACHGIRGQQTLDWWSPETAVRTIVLRERHPEWRKTVRRDHTL